MDTPTQTWQRRRAIDPAAKFDDSRIANHDAAASPWRSFTAISRTRNIGDALVHLVLLRRGEDLSVHRTGWYLLGDLIDGKRWMAVDEADARDRVELEYVRGWTRTGQDTQFGDALYTRPGEHAPRTMRSLIEDLRAETPTTGT